MKLAILALCGAFALSGCEHFHIGKGDPDERDRLDRDPPNAQYCRSPSPHDIAAPTDMVCPDEDGEDEAWPRHRVED
jgi:hypothetical protein